MITNNSSDFQNQHYFFMLCRSSLLQQRVLSCIPSTNIIHYKRYKPYFQISSKINATVIVFINCLHNCILYNDFITTKHRFYLFDINFVKIIAFPSIYQIPKLLQYLDHNQLQSIVMSLSSTPNLIWFSLHPIQSEQLRKPLHLGSLHPIANPETLLETHSPQSTIGT